MSDFNIKKFLAESERLSYADFTSGQRRRKPQTPSSELTGFEPQFQHLVQHVTALADNLNAVITVMTPAYTVMAKAN